MTQFLKFKVIVFCVIFFSGFLVWGNVEAATINAASCSYEDVSAAVSAASSGDTINVPAGLAIWDNPLIISRGIILKGAGIGNTVITSNITNALAGIIKIAPALNESFRITGFTLDGNQMSNGIYLSNRTTTKMNKIRIDHNRIINPGGDNAGRCIYIGGTIYGVIDNNVFEQNPDVNLNQRAIESSGLNDLSWINFTQDLGSADNIYYEDNIFYGPRNFHFSGQGGRYVTRYNNYISNGTVGMFMMDAHGNQHSDTYANYSTMVTEVYGNFIDFKGKGGRILDHRGGKALVFSNHMYDGANPYSVQVREEADDNYKGDGFLQHVTDSYYWKNRGSAVALYKAIISQDTYDFINTNDPPVIIENRDFWQERESFSGVVDVGCQYSQSKSLPPVDTCITGGVGCGALANRPVTCTTGVGYWATDQSCADLTGMVGKNPINPISGTLYKCTSTNNWEAYYTPYTYPHPLRNESPATNTTPPAVPSGLAVN